MSNVMPHMNAPDTPTVSIQKPRRPVSLWLLLVAAWGLGALFSVGVVKHLYEAAVGSNVQRSLINAGILIIVSGYLIGLAIAIHRRNSWAARTLGTLFLMVFALAAFFGPGSPSPSCAGTEDCVQGWWLGRLLLTMLFIGWAVAAGWSPGEKRYYLASQSSVA
jgi:hypothetical protein